MFMIQMSCIWVYNYKDYYIAKYDAFAMYKEVLDKNGTVIHELVQGVSMILPTAWDWKIHKDGRIFAGFQGNTYDITDIEHVYYPRL